MVKNWNEVNEEVSGNTINDIHPAVKTEQRPHTGHIKARASFFSTVFSLLSDLWWDPTLCIYVQRW